MSQIYATREQWLNAFVLAMAPVVASHGYELPSNIRVSLGFASAGMRSKSIGECWAVDASADGHSEIFISPTLGGDVSRIADVVTHEVVHAIVGHGAKHGRPFAKLAKALGLEGKMTATVAGLGWHEWADPIIASLGDFPGAALTGKSSAKPKQSTRMVKATCNHEGCGMILRTTRKWFDHARTEALNSVDPNGEAEDENEELPEVWFACPIPGHGQMALEVADEGEGE